MQFGLSKSLPKQEDGGFGWCRIRLIISLRHVDGRMPADLVTCEVGVHLDAFFPRSLPSLGASRMCGHNRFPILTRARERRTLRRKDSRHFRIPKPSLLVRYWRGA